MAPSKISTGGLEKGCGGLNSQDGVKRTRRTRGTFAGRRILNVIDHFAAAGVVLHQRTTMLSHGHLWPRKAQNHRNGQKPSCRLKATIHFLKGSPNPHPFK